VRCAKSHAACNSVAIPLFTPASHGCIRLHPSNTAALYSLVKQHGTGNTVIEISH
jgi:L,D-transpeptidase-like protein